MAGFMFLTDSPSTVLALLDDGASVVAGDVNTASISLGDSGLALILGDIPVWPYTI